MEIIIIISSIAGLVLTFQTIMLKRFEIREKRAKAEKEKADEEKEKNRDKSLDNKLSLQNELMKTNIKELIDTINFVGEKVDKTNERIDILTAKFDNHEGESNTVKKFDKVHRYSEIMGVDSWVTDERAAKYKLILESWFSWIKKYSLEHFESKSNKIGWVNEYDPEMKMRKLIDDFATLCDSLIHEYVKKEKFSVFAIDKKKIHALSEGISLSFKMNNKNSDEFNEMISSYLISFSTLYQKSVLDWIKLYDKQYADA